MKNGILAYSFFLGEIDGQGRTSASKKGWKHESREGRRLAVEWSKFSRIYEIDKRIRANSYPSVGKLSQEFEVSKRTIERDLSFMRDFFGAPLRYDPKRRGYYYAGGDFKLPPVSLTEGEAVAIFLAQKVLGHYKGTPYENQIKRAIEKILFLLPDQIVVDFGFFESAISFRIGELRGDEEKVAGEFEAITRAIKECRVIEMDYYTASRDEETSRRVHPYHLRYHGGCWYMIAFCCMRNEVRIFALDRIRRLEVTEDHFEKGSGFSIEEYLGGSMGIELGGEAHVVVRFDREQARFIRERVWHPSQVTEELEDGGLLLSMDVRGLGEVKRWILGYGRHAEVLKPEWLREEMAEEVKHMSRIYG